MDICICVLAALYSHVLIAERRTGELAGAAGAAAARLDLLEGRVLQERTNANHV